MCMFSMPRKAKLMKLLTLASLFLLVADIEATPLSHQEDSILALAKDPKQSAKVRAECYTKYARLVANHNLDSSIYYARKAIDIAVQINDFKLLADAYIRLGDAYNEIGNFSVLYQVADSIAFFARQIDYKEAIYSSYIIRGEGLRRKAQFDESLKNYMEAATVAESIENKWYLARAYGAIRALYTTIHDIPRAMEFQRKSHEVWLTTSYTKNIMSSYGAFGILHREMGQYDSALYYYRKSAQYAFQTEDNSWIAYCGNDIGAAHSFLGNYDSAAYYLNMSIAIRERLHQYDELPYTYNYLGENYERQGNLQEAERYIRKALQMAISLENNKQTYEAYESLSDFFARNHRYDSAYRYAILHKQYKDSFITSQQNEIIAELTTRYETEKKERIIQEQQQKIVRKNIGIASVSLLLVTLSITGYAYYRRKKSEQELFLQKEIMHQQELAGKAVIEAEENERQRIASDLHDGIGQMMSAAKLNLSSLKDQLSYKSEEAAVSFEKAMSLVDESCREVRTVSHNIMPNALLKHGLTAAIRNFIDKIDQRIIEVSLYAEGFQKKMDPSTESVLYRVIQECVNNAIRHAEANKLDISLVQDEEGISVSIEDNGKGFHARDAQAVEGIGMKNIRSRVGYLKGTVEWDSAPDKGTVVMIHIPTSKS
jgi:two-component system NarL family sensor kinase